MAEVLVLAAIEEVPSVPKPDEVPVSTEETILSGKTRKIPLFVIFKDASRVFNKDELGMEILRIAVPAALALVADPIASLIDTAFIGRIGPVELAAVGVSIAVFNQVSKVTIFPLVSIRTSFVAKEETVARVHGDEHETNNLEKGLSKCNDIVEFIPEYDNEKAMSQPSSSTVGESKKSKSKHVKRHIPSASSALVIGRILGLLQTIFLIFASQPVLSFMGVKSILLSIYELGSPMMNPALRYLTLRSLGSPSVLLSLAMQGIFRGFKDTKTPLFATVAGDLTNIILDPILMFVFHLGVSGAALAHVISQYFIAVILLWRLMKQIELLPPSIKDLQFSRFLKNGNALVKCPLAPLYSCSLHLKFVAASQPLNSLAFVYDGVNFGASDFSFTGCAMVLVAAVSIVSLIFLSSSNGFVGIWIALTLYMSLRALAGYWRMGT